MARSTEDVKNWVTMFRWIVKLIRDEYDIEEAKLVRHAVVESEVGLTVEQLEQVLDAVSASFQIRFPDGTLDEIVKLEELCMLASWIKGFYKRPEFVSDGFGSRCHAANPGMA